MHLEYIFTVPSLVSTLDRKKHMDNMLYCSGQNLILMDYTH